MAELDCGTGTGDDVPLAGVPVWRGRGSGETVQYRPLEPCTVGVGASGYTEGQRGSV